MLDYAFTFSGHNQYLAEKDSSADQNWQNLFFKYNEYHI